MAAMKASIKELDIIANDAMRNRTKLVLGTYEKLVSSNHAIVNAANDNLTRGGGVCDEIFKVADSNGHDGELAAAIAVIMKAQPGKVPVGQSRVTDSFGWAGMPGSTVVKIIHTNGPEIKKNGPDKLYPSPTNDEQRKFIESYQSILASAYALDPIDGQRRVAICCIRSMKSAISFSAVLRVTLIDRVTLIISCDTVNYVVALYHFVFVISCVAPASSASIDTSRRSTRW